MMDLKLQHDADIGLTYLYTGLQAVTKIVANLKNKNLQQRIEI